MEIYSIRSSPNPQFRNNNKSNSKPEDPAQLTRKTESVFEPAEADPGKPDFSSISAEEVRAIARNSFDLGQIDYDTFSAMYEGLPMQTIDANGAIIDLSDVADTTPFNFLDYFQTRLTVASTIGDARTAQILRSVVYFMNSQ
jgi:hypothetical protein